MCDIFIQRNKYLIIYFQVPRHMRGYFRDGGVGS